MSPRTEMYAQVKELLIAARERGVQDANRCHSQRLAHIVHELRTPLGSIIGFAELMHDDKVGAVSARQKEYLGDILSSSHELVQLINGLHQDIFRVDVQEEGIDVLAERVHRILVEFQRKAEGELRSTATVSDLRAELEP